MVTRLNKLIVCFILINVTLLGYSQVEDYTILSVDSIMIGKFKYGGDIQNFKEKMGSPIGYKEFSEPYPIEGYGKSFYLTYDSLKVTFVEFYGKIILSNITIKGRNHIIKIGKYSKIQIGDSLESLNQFKKSYTYFLRNNPLPYKNKEQYFYLNLLIVKNEYQYYGLIKIKLIKNKVEEMSFRFDEGT